jgi:hypothetical protein
MMNVDEKLRTKMAEIKDWADTQDPELAREGLRVIKEVFLPVVGILHYLKNEAMGFPAFELAHTSTERLWVVVSPSSSGAPQEKFLRTDLQPDQHGRYQPRRIEWSDAVAVFRHALRDQLMASLHAFADMALAERDRQRAHQAAQREEVDRLVDALNPRDTPKP